VTARREALCPSPGEQPPLFVDPAGVAREFPIGANFAMARHGDRKMGLQPLAWPTARDVVGLPTRSAGRHK
jgi:hypothetical protein